MALGFALSSGIDFDLDLDEPVPIIGSIEASYLYYIAQEAIINGVKHSQAANIVVALFSKKDTIRLIISDDGKGFSKKGAEKGIGLEIMKYRAKMIGAFLDIESDINYGTTIRVTYKKTESHD